MIDIKSMILTKMGRYIRDREHNQYTFVETDESSATHEALVSPAELSQRHSRGIRRFFSVGSLLLLSAGFALGFILRGTSLVGGRSRINDSSTYTVDDTLWWNTEYSSMNSTTERLDQLWDTTIPWESGIIALTTEEARAMHLPESQPFPWDPRRKSIYIVNAYHILHCVRNIYISIRQYRTSQPQTISYAHILHCVDSLRVEAMCSADDTPRYVPLNSDEHGFRPGDGQSRKCRDWARLQSFVNSHDPCYRYLRPGDGKLSNLERFKFCPDSSGYLPIIRKYFGYHDDWVPEPRQGQRELEWDVPG